MTPAGLSIPKCALAAGVCAGVDLTTVRRTQRHVSILSSADLDADDVKSARQLRDELSGNRPPPGRPRAVAIRRTRARACNPASPIGSTVVSTCAGQAAGVMFLTAHRPAPWNASSVARTALMQPNLMLRFRFLPPSSVPIP